MTVVLAPLAGLTDAPFRRLCRDGGADLTYTEMVSAAGLAHGSSPTRHLMETLPGEGPVACQLFGSTAEELAGAAAEAAALTDDDGAPRFCEINLNAGCPMTKVTKSGAGAKLAEDPEKIYRLLSAMTGATDRPVTLKTRLGPHPGRTTIFEILDAAERAGAAGLIVHARYTSQMHGGATHLDLLAEVVRRARIPVTGNGSVVDARTAKALAATGVSAVMVGRAALPDPGIFARLKGEPPAAVGSDTWVERHLAALLAFRRRLAERFPADPIPSEDAYASVKMHTHLFRYFNGRPGAAALRARLNAVRTLAEIRTIISASRHAARGFGTLSP
jgi:nifR3 family TIM-barrel protein